MPGNYPKYLGELGVKFRLAILNWSTEDVLRYLNGEENPLYRHGFDRVGCFPCLAAGDGTKIKAFQFDEFGAKQWETVQELQEITDKSVFRSKIGNRWKDRVVSEDFQGCSICAM